MKKIPLKDGSGDVEFSEREWEHFLAMGKSYKTQEEKKEFYEGVMEAKKKDPKFSVFDAFPLFETEAQRLANKYVPLILAKMRNSKITE